jgi:hypothetical protein
VRFFQLYHGLALSQLCNVHLDTPRRDSGERLKLGLQHYSRPQPEHRKGEEKEWRPQALQMVREVQARQVPPLSDLPHLHSQDGSPLPMDLQLRGVPQLQILLLSDYVFGSRLPDHEHNHVGLCVQVSRRKDSLFPNVLSSFRPDIGIFHVGDAVNILGIPFLLDVLGNDHY